MIRRNKKKMSRRTTMRLKMIKETPVRLELIEHVLTYYPFWEKGAPYMKNDFLLNHCQAEYREDFRERLINEK